MSELDVLAELMLSAIPTDSMGYPLLGRVRYFDPGRRLPLVSHVLESVFASQREARATGARFPL